MSNLIAPGRFLKAVLWLITVHSAAVGLGLIFLPNAAITFFGFDCQSERFFQAQGGVFHLVMAVAYGLAAVSERRRAYLTELAIIAKLMATLFLCSYYFLVDQVWMILASAAGDCLLGLLTLLAYLRWVRPERGAGDRCQDSERFGDA